MKKNIFFILFFFAALSGFSQSIQSFSFNNITGSTIQLSSYTGKKVLIVIAPISSADSVRLNELKVFQLRYGDSVKIIGVMSIENGYLSTNNTAIKNLYESRGIEIELTGGMYTKKAAGQNQASIMKWLTEKEENNRYDIDAQGIWQKFFINKEGKLYGVVPPRTSLFDSTVGWILFREI